MFKRLLSIYLVFLSARLLTIYKESFSAITLLLLLILDAKLILDLFNIFIRKS